MQQHFEVAGIRPRAEHPQYGQCSSCGKIRLTLTRPFVPAGSRSGRPKTKVVRVSKANATGRPDISERSRSVKKRFCLECIAGHNIVQLHEPKMLRSVSATPIITANDCLEQYGRSIDPILRDEGIFIMGRFIGSMLHQAVSRYIQAGSTNVRAQLNLCQEIVGRGIQGKRIPKRVQKDTNNISWTVFRLLRQAINAGLLETRSRMLMQDPQLLFVGSEVHFRIPLSELIRHYLSPEITESLKTHDALVTGSIDRLTYYDSVQGFDGRVAVVSDYKTFWPESRYDQDQIKLHYINESLQLLLYGLIASWMVDDVAPSHVIMQPIFINPNEGWYTQKRRIKPEDVVRIAERVLRNVYKFAENLQEVARDKPKHFVGEPAIARFYRPTVRSEVCSRCPYLGICTATRGTTYAEKLFEPLEEEENIEEYGLTSPSA